MLLTPRINEAIKLASRLHRNQIRKDIGHTPYISHLVSVAIMLGEATNDEDIIIAGLMHDALEDVPEYTYDNLVKDCGETVASIVRHVTEPLDANKLENEQMPWLKRKEIYLENLKQGGLESAMVSAADKIHNIESLILDTRNEGEPFLHRFGSSLRNTLWFHEQVYAVIVEKLGNDHILATRLFSGIEQFRSVVKAYE